MKKQLAKELLESTDSEEPAKPKQNVFAEIFKTRMKNANVLENLFTLASLKK
jgi:hypothetical protein